MPRYHTWFSQKLWKMDTEIEMIDSVFDETIYNFQNVVVFGYD